MSLRLRGTQTAAAGRLLRVLRVRVPRLLLVALAGYELRGLAGCVGDVSRFGAASSGGLSVLGVLALISGWMLFQTGRGLKHVAVTPRWVLRLFGIVLMVCSAPVVFLSAGEALAGHSLLAQPVLIHGLASNVEAVLGCALMCAVVIGGVSWLVRGRMSLRCGELRHPGDPPVRRLASDRGSPSLPMLAGWCDRGPPRFLV